MTGTEWIETSLEELQDKIAEQEDEFVGMFIDDYLGDFYVDDTSLKNTSGNYDRINAINRKFDEAYDEFLIPFLLWFGKKLIDTQKFAVSSFKEASYGDVEFMKKQIGLDGKKIIKGSYLWNLGKMGELRQRFQDLVIKAVSSGQKYNVFLRNAKGMFKSTRTKRSALSTFYMKYAYDSVAQTLSSTSYYLAKKYGYTKFIYEGGLVKDSRPFCVDRAGKEFTIEEAQEWNNMDWKGKMQGVDFFVARGGWNCLHHINWIE